VIELTISSETQFQILVLQCRQLRWPACQWRRGTVSWCDGEDQAESGTQIKHLGHCALSHQTVPSGWEAYRNDTHI